jgi:hypothetical protein
MILRIECDGIPGDLAAASFKPDDRLFPNGSYLVLKGVVGQYCRPEAGVKWGGDCGLDQLHGVQSSWWNRIE